MKTYRAKWWTGVSWTTGTFQADSIAEVEQAIFQSGGELPQVWED